MSFKKDVNIDSFKSKIKILVQYYLENMNEYGIKVVNYKRQE